jgi:hypothetical protein
MNDNPYESPTDTSTPDDATSRSDDELRRLAKLQRVICGCVWIQAAMVGGTILCRYWDRATYEEYVMNSAWLGMVGIGVVGGVFSLLLVNKVRGGWQCVVFGLGAPVPLIGLLALLGAHAMATRELGRNGIKVGWLSADLRNLDSHS